MKFKVTSVEAQPHAIVAAKYLKRLKYSVRVEASPWQDAPYRTTLLGECRGKYVLVEAQGSIRYHKALQSLAEWLSAKRHYCELVIVSHSEANMLISDQHEMKTDGVGLWTIDSGNVRTIVNPRNPALVITPEPSLALGKLKKAVDCALAKYNDGERKDGIRDLCEIVELETDHLLRTLAHKNRLKFDEKVVDQKDWGGQIDALASGNSFKEAKPAIDDKLKSDLHSFRGARNLFDHKAKGWKEVNRREIQLAERMMQGPRLLAELASIQRTADKLTRLP